MDDYIICKNFEKQIPTFLSEYLDDEKLEAFVLHIKNCDSCKEELAIQYLATEGIQRLEEGASFSLDEELRNRIALAWHKVRVNMWIGKICDYLEGIAIIVLGIIITYMIW